MTTSREHAWRAVRALEVYLNRGQAALACLERGDAEQAADLLAKRNAAFCNFRALDAVAQAAGEDISRCPRGVEIFRAVRELEPQLVSALVAARDQARDQYRYVRATRRKLNQGYGSSTTEGDSRFAQSV